MPQAIGPAAQSTTRSPQPRRSAAIRQLFQRESHHDGALTFDQTGTGALVLQGGAADRTLTLGGNVVATTNAATVGAITLGNVTTGSHLNVDLGGASRTFNVQSGGTINVVNAISNGSIVVDGGGTVNLGSEANAGGSSTFSGGITVVNGTLNSNGENATSAFGTSAITLGGGDGSGNATLGHVNGSLGTITNTITVTAGSGLRSIAPGSGNDHYAGAITLNAGSTLTLAPSSNGELQIAGGIIGTGNVVVNQTVGSYNQFSIPQT